MATKTSGTWTGAGGDALWSNAGNWNITEAGTYAYPSAKGDADIAADTGNTEITIDTGHWTANKQLDLIDTTIKDGPDAMVITINNGDGGAGGLNINRSGDNDGFLKNENVQAVQTINGPKPVNVVGPGGFDSVAGSELVINAPIQGYSAGWNINGAGDFQFNGGINNGDGIAGINTTGNVLIAGTGYVDQFIINAGIVSVPGDIACVFGFTLNGGILRHTGGMISAGGARKAGTVSSVGTLNTVIASNVTNGDDTWNTHVLVFDSDTATEELRGVAVLITDWTKTPRTFTLAENLPALAQVGDTFNVYYGVTTATTRTVTAAKLTQTDGFWDGFNVVWGADTPTEALRGTEAFVESFAGQTMTFAEELPTVPAAGDYWTFTGPFKNTGGILAPGQSIGTTSIQGSYIQGENGTLEIEVDGSAADFVDVGGTAILDGSIDVKAIGDPGDFAYVVLEAEGGISGCFQEVVTDLKDIIVTYTATQVIVSNRHVGGLTSGFKAVSGRAAWVRSRAQNNCSWFDHAAVTGHGGIRRGRAQYIAPRNR